MINWFIFRNICANTYKYIRACRRSNVLSLSMFRSHDRCSCSFSLNFFHLTEYYVPVEYRNITWYLMWYRYEIWSHTKKNKFNWKVFEWDNSLHQKFWLVKLRSNWKESLFKVLYFKNILLNLNYLKRYL